MPHDRNGKKIDVGAVVLAPYPGCDKDAWPKIIGVVETTNPSSQSCNGNLHGICKVIAPGVVVPWQGGTTCFTLGDATLIV